MNIQRFRLPIVLLGLVALLPSLRAQSADAARVLELGRKENRVMEHLDHLSNRIGPRLTGSDGFANACQWTLEQFQAFGLSNCKLEEWGEFPVGFNRGPSYGRMITPENKELHFGTNAWTAGTRGPVRGPCVMAPTNEAELEAVRSRLAGAWVIVAPATPGGGRRPEGAPTARADGATSPAAGGAPGGTPAEAGARTEGGRAEGAEGGNRRGGRQPGGADGGAAADARAFREKLEKAYDEAGVLGSISSARGELILTGGNYRIDFDKLPTRPAIKLLEAEHKEILRRVKEGETVSLEFDIRHWFEKGPIKVHNVVAEIVGTEKPDEVVIVSGHLDTWDGATGTTDNGTGCATTMEAARLLVKAGVKPKRTIRFILWGGEEQGLLGSAAYVKMHKDEMEKISACLVHDGGTNYCAGILATPPMVPLFEEVFAPVMDLDPEMPFAIREVKGLSGGGSDHSSFLSANVPGFFWSQKGRANYNYTHHTQFDTYEQAIPEYQRNSSLVIAIGALGIANLPTLLPRENLRAPSGGGRRTLGVQLGDGMVVEELTGGGVAEKSGIKVGDKILKIGDEVVADSDELRTVLRGAPEKTKVSVLRGGQTIEIAIELPAPPPPQSASARRLGVRFGEGLSIDVVTPGGVGDMAGIQMGDKILKAGDRDVATMAELDDVLRPASGETRVSVQRGAKTVELKLPLTAPQ